MAIEGMTLIEIIGFLPQLEDVVEICGKSHVFHPDNAGDFHKSLKDFTPLQDKTVMDDILSVWNTIFKKLDKNPRYVTKSGFNPTKDEISDYSKALDKNLLELIREKEKVEKDIEFCKKEIEETSHFIGLGLDTRKIAELKYIQITFGKMPIESYAKLQRLKDDETIAFFPCTSDETHYWGIYVCTLDKIEDARVLFSGLYFEEYNVPSADGTPSQYLSELESRVLSNEQQIKKLEEKTQAFFKKEEENIYLYYTAASEEASYSRITDCVYHKGRNFILLGWVPDKYAKGITDKLESLESVECSISSGKEELNHSPPIKLKNNFITKPFRFFIDMYGMPSYNEIDPTGFVAITFIVLFGIMFGDVGQGICVSIAGYLLWKFKELQIGKVLIPCGVSSAIFGFVYGSVFGFEDWLNPLYHAIGLKDKPVEIMRDATLLIAMSVVIGVVLVILSMSLNIYSSFKRRDFGRAIFSSSGLAGIIFYSALVFGMVAEILLSTHIMTTPYVVCLIILPLILMFLEEPLSKLVKKEKNWMPKGIGEFIMQSFFELFEAILSYATNTMSYLRVGAFVLIHAGMMLVIFTLADLLGGISIVLYIIMVIFGNAFVMLLEGLLVCIQLMRLEYYEMFSRYYLGQGRAYNPVRLTKPPKLK